MVAAICTQEKSRGLWSNGLDLTGTDLYHCFLLVGLQDLRQVIHALLVDWEQPLHVAMVDFKLAVVAEPLAANQASMIRQPT